MFFLAFSTGANSQYYFGGLFYEFPRTSFVVDSAGNVRFQPHDLKFSFQTGAFAGSDFHGNSWFGTSVAPALAYNVSDRFRLKVGVNITQGYGNALYGWYDNFYYPANNSPTTTSIFVQGDYLLSNKLMLSGAVYKYFSPYNININDPRFKSPDGEGILFNINYRPARNFEINASFEYGRGNSPYYRSPFYQPTLFAR